MTNATDTLIKKRPLKSLTRFSGHKKFLGYEIQEQTEPSNIKLTDDSAGHSDRSWHMTRRLDDHSLMLGEGDLFCWVTKASNLTEQN